MLMPRIVNTKPCNLQSAFVIFTSNFSCSAERVPHMKMEESQSSHGMRQAKNGRRDGWRWRGPQLSHVRQWSACYVTVIVLGYALSGFSQQTYSSTACSIKHWVSNTTEYFCLPKCSTGCSVYMTYTKKTQIFNRPLLWIPRLFYSHSPQQGLTDKSNFAKIPGDNFLPCFGLLK